MTASAKQRSQAAIKRQRAWELHVKGVSQFKIADELGVTEARVSQYIKQAAAQHPVTALDLNERIALSEARWQTSEDEIRGEIVRQQKEGQIWREVTRHPDGTETVTIRKTYGVDPALLRALSTHHDRRARQLNNQLSPDQNVQAVNVSIVKDFLQQADGAGARLTPEQWNEQQGSIDV